MRAKTIILTLSLFLFSQIAVADDTLTVEIYSDSDITAWINATANGSAIFYIQGTDILSEIDALWDAVKSAKSKADSAYGKASSAYSKASKAYAIAKDNKNRISLIEADVENNTAKIYILRDELVSFEDEYIKFKNRTIANITTLRTICLGNVENISLLKSNYDSLRMILTYSVIILAVGILSLSVIEAIVWKKLKKKVEVVRKDGKDTHKVRAVEG